MSDLTDPTLNRAAQTLGSGRGAGLQQGWLWLLGGAGLVGTLIMIRIFKSLSGTLTAAAD